MKASVSVTNGWAAAARVVVAVYACTRDNTMFSYIITLLLRLLCRQLHQRPRQWIEEFAEPGVIGELAQKAGMLAMLGDDSFPSAEKEDVSSLPCMMHLYGNGNGMGCVACFVVCLSVVIFVLVLGERVRPSVRAPHRVSACTAAAAVSAPFLTSAVLEVG